MHLRRPPLKSPLLLLSALAVLTVAILFSRSSFRSSLLSGSLTLPVSSALSRLQQARPFSVNTMSPQKTPVYYFSHGGPNVMFETKHPAYPVLQRIGKEITETVKPKAVVVFSAHWEAEPGTIYVNTAEKTNLIYDYYGFPPEYYKVQYPNRGNPQLASEVLRLLSQAGIESRGVTRGPDHGVFAGFRVAFHPDENPLNVPLVQVSLFKNEDVDMHYRLGQAVASLREAGVVIICTGMSVHNLRDLWRTGMNNPPPLPYTVSFDDALKEAVEVPPSERRARMIEASRRPDARQAHPTFDHLVPLFIAAGAAGEDPAKQTWTMQEGSLGWAQYRFG
ncbi:LigB-domain-containing protein [Xylariomycetidae sp. FL2044]|nr:LigB-domain-containing protein [Xylariomycetidae sp. FL2044]